MKYIQVVNKEVVEITTANGIVDASGTQHPMQILDHWSDEELKAIGVYRVAPCSVEGVLTTKFVKKKGAYVEVPDMLVEPEPVVETAKFTKRLDVIEKMTDEELQKFVFAMRLGPIRVQEIWYASTEFLSNGELAMVLRAAFEELFGAERAGEILAV